jgi:cytoskeletal protein RodZ
MGVTLAEAEVATRIRQKYLAALESDEWDLLPGEVVGRGFLRNYATYLGLEPTEMIERRRAIADDAMAAVLVNTSAGSALPPERKVDYRPKDVALKDETNELETPRQLNLRPFLGILAAVALISVGWWAVTQFGSAIGAAFADAQRQVADLQTSLTNPPAAPTTMETPASAVATLPENLVAATATPAVAVVVPDRAAETAVDTAATPVDVVVEAPTALPAVETPIAAEAAPAAAPAATEEPISLLAVLPTPTPVAEVVPVAPAPEVPVPAAAVAAAASNLRGGPSTDFPVVGGATEGQALTITGRSADGTWYQLEGGAWIFAQLVTNPPVDVPVVETPPAPEPVAPAAEQPAVEQPAEQPADQPAEAPVEQPPAQP